MSLHKLCPFSAVRAQFDSDHHKNRRVSSHSYSHESVIFLIFFGLIFVTLRRVCVFSVEMHAASVFIDRLRKTFAGTKSALVIG